MKTIFRKGTICEPCEWGCPIFSFFLMHRLSARTFLSFLFQGSFPGNVHLVLVLRPSTFLQRALSDVFFKVNKDEFKMKVSSLGLFCFCFFRI